jgi:insulysin
MTAGLSYSLKPKQGALELRIKGYSDKATDFLSTIVSAMKIAEPSHEQFDLYYDLFARDYINSLNASPLKQGGEVLWGIIYQDFSSLDQKASALKGISYKHMKQFCQNILKECYVQGMLYGNITQTEAQTVWKQMKIALACAPFPPHKHAQVKLATLPAHDTASYLTIGSEHPANALNRVEAPR